MKTTIVMDSEDLGQVVDGLTCLAEEYELTAQYHETGCADRPIREISGAVEAKTLARWYRRLGEDIRGQLGHE